MTPTRGERRLVKKERGETSVWERSARTHTCAHAKSHTHTRINTYTHTHTHTQTHINTHNPFTPLQATPTGTPEVVEDPLDASPEEGQAAPPAPEATASSPDN